MKMRFAIPLLLALTCNPVFAMNMSIYHWKYRPLVVFAPSSGETALVEQRENVNASRQGFVDRDIVLVWVEGDKVTSDFGPKPGLSASALRQTYGVDGAKFKVLLVGKDGGVKISADKPLTSASLFRTIDAMPMRRDEIQSTRH